METTYLVPLTVFCLLLALAALGFRANRRRGYGPFLVGILAAVLLILGTFLLESSWAVYGAVASLIAASLWNSWPKSTSTTSVSFAPKETLLQIGSKRIDEHG